MSSVTVVLLQWQVSLRYIYQKYNINASNMESKVTLMHQTASWLVHPVAVGPWEHCWAAWRKGKM